MFVPKHLRNLYDRFRLMYPSLVPVGFDVSKQTFAFRCGEHGEYSTKRITFDELHIGRGCPRCHKDPVQREVRLWLASRNRTFIEGWIHDEVAEQSRTRKARSEVVMDFYIPSLRVMIKIQPDKQGVPRRLWVTSEKSTRLIVELSLSATPAEIRDTLDYTGNSIRFPKVDAPPERRRFGFTSIKIKQVLPPRGSTIAQRVFLPQPLVPVQPPQPPIVTIKTCVRFESKDELIQYLLSEQGAEQ